MVTQAAFWQGAARVLESGVVEGSSTVEGVHQAVFNTVARYAPVPLPLPGMTRFVYRSIRGVSRLVGTGATEALRLTAASLEGRPLEPWQLNLQSALNAAFGDHFAREAHPWAIPMAFSYHGQSFGLDPESMRSVIDAPSSKLVIFIHGLGMNDLAWDDGQGGGFARMLERQYGCTAISLRYNTGRHIHENGQELADLIDELLDAYPVSPESITLVGHSMGGLVARSATHYAEQHNRSWYRLLRGVACLGSPHQGARLELIGHWLSHGLSMTPYTEPLSVLGRRRSAGIKDLRFGSLHHEDWQDVHPDALDRVTPQAVPPPSHAAHLLVAGSVSEAQSPLWTHIGDGMVTVDSALSLREEVSLADSGHVSKIHLQGVDHLALLSHEKVGSVLASWYGELLHSH